MTETLYDTIKQEIESGQLNAIITEQVDSLDPNFSPLAQDKFTTGCSLDDIGNGERLVKLFGEKIHWVDILGKWFIFNGLRWTIDSNGEIERFAKVAVKSIFQEAFHEPNQYSVKRIGEWASKSQSRMRRNNMIEDAKSEATISIPITDFDRNPWALNFRNGTLNLKTGELGMHNPDELISKLIDLDYVPAAECPCWIQFLNEIMDNNQNMITFLQRAVGYSITGVDYEQMFLLCYGCGANGKSVFLETLLNALGPDYAKNTQAATILAKDRSSTTSQEIAVLRGMRIVTINEIPSRRRLDTAKIKELTGGDTITARFLFHEDFNFKPEFKLWMRTNHKPIITDADLGIWRRVRLIPFIVTIPPEEQDPKLQEKLKAEWSGIIAWAVRGCLDWQTEGLMIPEEVKASTAEYKADQDTMQPFIDDKCIMNPSSEVPAKELYTSYKDWCEVNGEKPMTNQAFGRELTERGYDKTHTRTGWIYSGLRIGNV